MADMLPTRCERVPVEDTAPGKTCSCHAATAETHGFPDVSALQHCTKRALMLLQPRRLMYTHPDESV
jgi:hypothetical protein